MQDAFSNMTLTSLMNHAFLRLAKTCLDIESVAVSKNQPQVRIHHIPTRDKSDHLKSSFSSSWDTDSTTATLISNFPPARPTPADRGKKLSMPAEQGDGSRQHG